MADRALVIALLGAESTGKTTLAGALAERIAEETGLTTTWVPEWLREWCDREGRTPRPEEQAAIAARQHERMALAARTHEVVVADTTALATAVYSRLLFGDRSLEAKAVELHAQVHFTLLTALDLPWVADRHQRDGEHVREPVDRMLRELLIAHRLPWALVAGTGAARLDHALDAVAPLLRARRAPKRGLFTRLADRDAAANGRPWICDLCDVPECEHAARPPRRPATS